ncbi:DC-STAMP domain-containing protein 2-like [Centruroides vittatus]|uniref:DC-STAMP domain-containing protein 2-like n=1 Tax=Centruroides vittatus TaxID=120091 RepID=UPI00350F0E96
MCIDVSNTICKNAISYQEYTMNFKYICSRKFLLIWKVGRALKRLQRAQENSMRINRGEKPKRTVFEILWKFVVTILKVMANFLCPFCLHHPDRKKGPVKQFFRRLMADGTFENQSIKGFVGMLISIGMIILFYMYFVYLINVSPFTTMLFCTVMGFIITLGAAFSVRIRCVVLLMLPQLFSRSGRNALLAFAYLLVLSGPMKNVIKNTDVLAGSIACGQEAVANQTKLMLKEMFAPWLSIVESLKQIKKSLQEFADNVKAVLKDIEKVVKNIVFKKAARSLEREFEVNISMIHVYNYSVEESKSVVEVKEDIMREVKKYTHWMTSLIELSDLAMLMFFAFLFISALKYQLWFRIKDKFDNYFLTFELRELDTQRCGMGKETIFPLSFKERMVYVTASSLRLSTNEYGHLASSLIILIITFIQIGFFIIIDYGLFWMLSMVTFHGQLRTENEVPSHIDLKVKGQGLLADMLRKLVGIFGPVTRKQTIVDTTNCLPRPLLPDYDRYEQIAFIFIISFFLAITESYGLRLRHVIAGMFFPERKKQRAVWLYNHILRTRMNFVKFLRRKIRQKYYGDSTLHEISFLEHFSAKFPIVEKIAKKLNLFKETCLGCGIKKSKNDPIEFIHCDNQNCKAIFCQNCFEEIGKKCVVCLSPMDYDDYSDISEEKDSSEEKTDEEIDWEEVKLLESDKNNEKLMEEGENIRKNVHRPFYAMNPKKKNL